MLEDQQQDLWPLIASIIYTAAWSVSFYGQLYQNYKYKSVEGFSLDYLILNISGYTFYGIYSSIGYFTDIPGAGTVVIADLIFVYHGLLMVAIQTYQCVIYKRGNNMISIQAIIIAITLWVIVMVQAVLGGILNVIEDSQYWNPVSVMGYSKLVISFIKYTPPAYWNYKRKSTKGWSIFNIILDLVGGTFSLASGGLSVTNGLNFTKIILAFVTIFYDLIFVFQHYCLYRKKQEIVEPLKVSILTNTNEKQQNESFDKIQN